MKTHRLLFLAGLALLTGAAATARAQSAPAPSAGTVAWGARDSHGQGVAVPAQQISVLVFLRAGQPQSAEAMALMGPVLKDRKDVQVVGIVSGDDAATGAPRLEKDGWKYPVVVDESYDASGKFTVRVWPSVVIVNPKGVMVAHIPGLPISLANDLAAYLDFSSGKIDQAGLEKALANREVVSDSEDQKAARHAEVALRLAEQGLTEQASTEAAKAIELKPTSGKLLANLARTELLLGNGKMADTLLGKIEAADVPPNELNLLKGWAALLGNRWADAKQNLLDASKLNPDPAESLYLLGRVYEHEGDAAHASECYRKAFEHTALGRPMTGQ